MPRFLLAILVAVPLSAATGPEVPQLAVFDQEMTALMAKWNVPGGSLAISRDGRLVLARGYGLADREAGTPVTPASLFRIASVSKPVTAFAILKLAEEGRLGLDDSVVSHLSALLPPEGPSDSRVEQITIRDLLRHAGGWDILQTGVDPQFTPHEIAAALGVSAPPAPEQIAAYALDLPLQAPPATRFAYSNVGYTILGRIVERVTGERYEDAARALLAPLGIRCMRIGGSFEDEAARGEVRYEDPSEQLAPSILDPSQLVPWPYGAMDIRALDAAGGWIASPVDIVRFTDAVDARGTDALSAASLDAMTARPAYATSGPYYALGWFVRVATWWHTGGLPGTASYLVRLPGGVNLFAVFNSLPSEEFYAELDAALGRALLSVTSWPEHDLYGSVAPCFVRRRAAAH